MTTEISNASQTINTDVLVLGGGAAGCGAAIAAKERGARVLIVEKGKLESSGALGGGNDHFAAQLNTDPETDSEQAVVKFFKGIQNGVTSTHVAKGLASVMPHMVQMLEEVGVDFVRNPDGTYLRTSGFGQPGAWFLNIRNGQYVKRFVAKKIRGMGIDVLDHVMVTRLLTDGNRVAGAVGFNVLDGSFYVLKAKTVVMALGNANPRVTTNSTRNPFNTWLYPWGTGSHVVMSYEAGAKILNLDLNQQATLLPKGYGAPGMNGINSMGGHELNALGERFMGKYHPMWENGPRRNQVLGTYQEIVEGKAPPILLDMRHLSKEDLDLLENVLMPGDKATYTDYMTQRGISFATHPLEAELSEIAFGGKIKMDEDFESNLRGLFSGCNFFACSGAMCGGYAAGIEAAKEAGAMRDIPVTDSEAVEKERERIFQPLSVSGEGLNPRSFEDAIRQVMDYYMGYIRNEQGMLIALEKLALIESYADDIRAKDYRELMRANEAKHLLTHCKLTTRAVIERKESGRAIYRRSDYPNLNPEMNECVVLWQENGTSKIGFEVLE
jgi:adenylylsulfate reductase subunit A